MRRTLFWSPNKLFRLVLTGRRTIVPPLDRLSFSFHSCPSRHSFDLYRPCYLLAKPCQPFSFLFFLSLLSPLSPLLPPPPPPPRCYTLSAVSFLSFSSSFDLYRPCYLLAKPCRPFSFLFFLSLLSSLSPLLPPPPLLYPVSRFIPVLNPVDPFPFCSSCHSFHLYRPCYPFYSKTFCYY